MNRKQVLRDRISRLLAKASDYNDLSAEDQDLFDVTNGELRSLEARDRNGRAAEFGHDQLRGSGSKPDAYATAFDRYLRFGETNGLNEVRSDGITTSPKGIQTDASHGGYSVPEAFWRNLQVALKAYGGLSSHFHQESTPTGAPMPWPTLDPTGVKATVLGQELTDLSVASPYTFGVGLMNAYTIATDPVLVSLQLINDSAFNVDSLLTRLIGEAIGRKLADLAVSGTGSAQHQGIIPALNGVGSAGTVPGAVTATGGYVTLATGGVVKDFTGTSTELIRNVINASTAVAMVKAVDPAYYGGSAWYMNSNQAWGIRTLVDANGRPLIEFDNAFDADNDMSGGAASVVLPVDDNVSAAQVQTPVATMLGFPVYIDNGIPDLSASTSGGPVFGSLSHAMVMRTVQGGASVLALRERFATALAVGYLGFVRSDIRSNDLRAAVTVKAAAS